MIDKKTASAQILRLTGLRFFPKDDKKALDELISALAQSAKTAEHAKQIIDAWLHDSTDALLPAQIYQLAARLDPGSAQNECKLCDGTGYARCHLLVIYEYNLNEQGRRCGIKSRKESVITREKYQQLSGLKSDGDWIVAEAVRTCDCRKGTGASA